MKKFLLISYYWPPGSGPGVQRWLKFAKYLPENGWMPIVLTVENGSFPGTDEALLKEISPDIKVYRTKTWEPFTIYNKLRGKSGNTVEVGAGAFNADKSIMRKIGTYIRSNYFIPDARLGWNRTAFPKAIELIKKYKIQHVVTTSPPHSSQLIGLAIQEKMDIKWLADLRDPWMSMMYNQFLTRTQRSIDKDQSYEDSVLRNADHITVIGDSMKKEFQSRAKNISVVTNGFDASDISSNLQTHKPYEKFTLFFMGNFLSQQSIESFWKAISDLDKNNTNLKNKFRFLIIGNVSEVVKRDIANAKIEHLIEIEQFQPHLEVIEKLKKSHLLFLPIPETKGNEMIITGKIFEYLASKIPIICIGPNEGDAARILKQANRKEIIEYQDQESILLRIQSALTNWTNTNQQQLHKNDLHLQFERSSLTKQMAEVLDSM